MTEEEKTIRNLLLLHYNRNEDKVEQWFDRKNKQLDEYKTARELIDKGEQNKVLRFVKICLTDLAYE